MANYTPLDLSRFQKEPISPPHPESAPIPMPEVQTIFTEVNDHESMDQEVKPHVEVTKNVPTVAPDLQKLGVTPVSNTPLTLTPQFKLPVSDEEIIKDKRAPVSSSKRWLGEFCVRILKKFHYRLKIIQGHVRRVVVKG